MKRYTTYLCSLFILLSAISLNAQQIVSPGADISRRQTQTAEQQLRQEAEQMSLDYQKSKQKDEAQPEEEAPEVFITLTDIEFSQSTVLPQSFFESLKTKYINKPLSAAQISGVIDDINNEYLLKGYIASKAFLPKQDLKNGVLFVSLIEGKIYDVTVSGNKHTKESYIKRTIDWPKFSDIKMQDLQQNILDFNAANDAKARINLAPGPVYGTTDVDIVITEPPLLTGSLFSDNAGQKTTGLYRGGAQASLNSITGYRDILSVGGMFAKGSNSVFTSYEIPEPWLATRVGVGFDYSNTKIVQGQLKPLDITGDFYNYYIYVKKPFFVRPQISNNATLTFNIKDGASYLSDITTQTTDLNLLTLSVDNINIFNGGYFFNMVSVSKGMKLFKGNKDFWRFNYNGEAYKNIYGPFAGNIKGRLQMADGKDYLPSSEQFQVGGAGTVRGYDEGFLLADKGMNINTELQYNFTSLMPKQVHNGVLYAFFDYARIFNSDSFILQPDLDKEIYSTGAGLRLGIFKYFDGNITVARTLKTNVNWRDNETKVLFFVQARF